jgi:shikimate kinase
MGSGKSSHGRKIARMMGYDFVDMDDWIIEKEGLSIPEIFSKYGEPYFRKSEEQAIIKLGDLERVVIATGGGTPCHGKNMDLLKNSGLTIYLKLGPEALLSRLKDSAASRPLMAGKTPEEMYETIIEMLREREPYYSRAHMIIDGLDEVNERIVNAIQRKS